jgi:hypothetical protein
LEAAGDYKSNKRDTNKSSSSVKRFNGPWRGGALLACAALAGPAPVLADSTAPDARMLGITEGILTYCTKVDPPSAVKYRERIKLLVQGASDATLVQVRNSDAYLKARESMDDFISKVDEHNAKRVCVNGLADHR